MRICKSDQQSWALRPQEEAVSEVIGFLTTFSIVAVLLLVAMLAFNDAQARASERVAEMQASSAAQRVAAAAIDLALLSPDSTQRISVAVELPLAIAGSGYLAKVCPSKAACVDAIGPTGPYVRIAPDKGAVQRQSTFLTGGVAFCSGLPATANAGTLFVTWNGSCIGLSNFPVT